MPYCKINSNQILSGDLVERNIFTGLTMLSALAKSF